MTTTGNANTPEQAVDPQQVVRDLLALGKKNGRLTLTPFGRWTARDRKTAERTAEGLWTVKQVVWEEI